MDIPHDQQLVGHSDADVLLHALTDALLGAAALGDIGEMFPNDDPANKNRDSAEMLRIASDCLSAEGYRVVNVDCVVCSEQPKLTPYKKEIRSRIAEILGSDTSRISVKAKTGESVGPVGRQEAIEARCVVLVAQKS